MEQRAARATWLRMWIANPIASVVLLVVLVGDALTLPKDWRNASVVGGLVRDQLAWVWMDSRPTGWHFGPEFFVVREPDGMRFIDPSLESWDELSSVMWRGDTAAAECQFRDSVYRSGFWAFTTEHHSRRLLIYPLVGDWSEADLATVRAKTFVESGVPLEVWQRVQQWSDIAGRDLVESKLLWWGIAHSALALVLLGCLLYSFTGWWAWFAAHPLSRAARRRARGLCPACGYDLHGIGGGMCPECGRRRA